MTLFDAHPSMRANRLLCELVDHDSGLNANLDRFEAIVVELVAGGVAVPLRARLGHLLSGAADARTWGTRSRPRCRTRIIIG